MTTYNTGNPIGSKDPRDLYDNAENLDKAVNSTGSDTWRDRMGRSRLTWEAIAKAGTGDTGVAIDAANRAVGAAGQAENEANRAAGAASRAENAEAVVDATNIKSYVVEAEAARDAAFVNADVYPDVATGRAAVADGEQFQVVEGDEIVRYRNESGSAVEVARYPSAGAFTEEIARAKVQERLARWELQTDARSNRTAISIDGTSTVIVGWTNLNIMTGDGAARPVADREESELPSNTALYIDTTQEFSTAYPVVQAALDGNLQTSFVTGQNFLLLANRNGQLFGPLALTMQAAKLQRDKLSISDADVRSQYGLIRLSNVTGTGSAISANIPGTLTGVIVDGYIGWRMPAANEATLTLTFGGVTYGVKDMTGADIPAGTLPFGTDVIARMRGDGTVRLVGRYSNPDLTTLTAIQQAAAAAPSASEGEFLIFNPATSTWVTMNIDEVTSPMKKYHDIDASGVAGLAPQPIVRAADAAQQVTVANVSDSGMIAVGLGGKTPVINGSGSLTLAPGAVLSMDYPPAGDVQVLSDVAGTAFTARVKTARPYLSTAKVSADALLSRYAGTLTAKQRSAVRSLYAAFHPVLDQFLYLYVLASPDAPLALLNWAGDDAATPVASPTFVAGQGYTLNGTTQHLLTGKTWNGSPFGAADRMMMAVSVDETINGATRAAISSGNSQIEANRSASSHGFRSAATSNDTITGSAAGGLIVAQRSDLDGFTVLRNGKEEGKLYREGASNLMSYEHVIGAGTGSAGPTNEATHWAGTVQLAAAGNPLPEKEWARINAAWDEYLTEIGA